MELIGIILSVPASFVATIIYTFILNKIISRWLWISEYFLLASVFILALFLLEFIGVITIGALILREHIGSIFNFIHIVLFFLAIPSLANVLQLQKERPFFSKWYITAFACAIFAIFVVFLQIVVAEALYGIDGTDGPYS